MVDPKYEVFFDYRRFFQCLLDSTPVDLASAAFQAHQALRQIEYGHKARFIDFDGEKKELAPADIEMVKYFFGRLPHP